ncbi:unnamed protein product [Somion occarium]|uniref:ABC transporter domain-containing protein n=1 Tax=Somion occarium TaxID=3059160 RepID=A0ABP1CZK0_9APHY
MVEQSSATNEIWAKDLTYKHAHEVEPSLINISFALPKGTRTILVGANGAGKSTLLQILAGKRLLTQEGTDVRIKDKDVFLVRGDIVVSDFLNSVGGYRHKDRRDILLDILDVDLDWHMHAISDGERRRVQLVMGLMGQWDVLLLDEVTVDLDVLVRDDLLTFLKSDSETRGATILYATHIFDGLDTFPTHVAHMHLGAFVTPPTSWPFSDVTAHGCSPRLYNVALEWLKKDRAHRRELERNGRKARGANKSEVPSDSETFYRKYDYSH